MSPISKIILYREEVGKPLEDMLDEFVIAIASDRPTAWLRLFLSRIAKRPSLRMASWLN
jgi:molybdopterin-guanine dinucleotide biosynthesis adapter protein